MASRRSTSYVGHGTDMEEARAPSGGGEPVREPFGQDSAGPGRGIGLSVSTLLGALLIVVPVVWMLAYLGRVTESNLGPGFAVIAGIVLAAVLGGLALLLGLLRVPTR